MSGGTFEIDIPDTPSGRIHVGLSWNDIYDEKTSETLTDGDVAKAKFSTLPKLRILIMFLIVTVLGQAVTLQLTYLAQTIIESVEPSWAASLVTLIITTALFSFMLYKAINQEGFFLLLGEKHEDDKGRDKDFLNFDVDLHCFAYDQNKNFLYEVNSTSEKLVNPGETTTIYHSGEDTDGAGVYDDETIHIETKKLHDEHYLVFAVSNDCAHDFTKTNNLKARLANSQTDETLLNHEINSDEADGYIFCCMYKENDKWISKAVQKYTPFNEQWQNTITKTLDEI